MSPIVAISFLHNVACLLSARKETYCIVKVSVKQVNEYSDKFLQSLLHQCIGQYRLTDSGAKAMVSHYTVAFTSTSPK